MSNEVVLRSADQMMLAETEMRSAAQRAAAILKLPGTTHKIQGRRYVGKEGSTAIGQVLGLYPVQSKPEGVYEGHELLGWEASCQIVDMGGTIRARAFATCWLDELDRYGKLRWERQTAYSMAQTRALVKAYGMVISPIIAISDTNVSSTPAEEMPVRLSQTEDLPMEQPAGVAPEVSNAARRATVSHATRVWFLNHTIEPDKIDPDRARLMVDAMMSKDAIQSAADVETALNPLKSEPKRSASSVLEDALAIL